MITPPSMPNVFSRIGQNTAILLAVNIIGAITGFLLAAALGRNLGDTGFGQYSLVMTWLLSLTILAEFGLSTVLTRDLAVTPHLTPVYLRHSLVVKAVLGLPVVLFLWALAPQLATGQNPEVSRAIRWGVLFFYGGLGYSSFTAIFRAHQWMWPIFWTTAGGQLLLLTGTAGLLWQNSPLWQIVLWAGLVQWLQVGLAGLFLRQLPLMARSSLHINNADIKILMIKAWPFALAGLLAALQLRGNTLLLAYLGGDQAMGWYSAANRFTEAGKLLPSAFYAAILPELAAMTLSSGTAVPKIMRQAQLGLLGFGSAAMGGALLLGPSIIGLVYGPGYHPSILILQLLTLALIPALQNNLSVIYLYAGNDEIFVNLLIMAGVVINLGLCGWLIPLWGAMGTAIALLVTEYLLYVAYRFRMTMVNKRIDQTD